MKQVRRMIGCAPCGPILSMIDIELRGKHRGAKAQLLQEAIFKMLGPKYPKLAERYKVLREEKAA